MFRNWEELITYIKTTRNNEQYENIVKFKNETGYEWEQFKNCMLKQTDDEALKDFEYAWWNQLNGGARMTLRSLFPINNVQFVNNSDKRDAWTQTDVMASETSSVTSSVLSALQTAALHATEVVLKTPVMSPVAASSVSGPAPLLFAAVASPLSVNKDTRSMEKSTIVPTFASKVAAHAEKVGQIQQKNGEKGEHKTSNSVKSSLFGSIDKDSIDTAAFIKEKYTLGICIVCGEEAKDAETDEESWLCDSHKYVKETKEKCEALIKKGFGTMVHFFMGKTKGGNDQPTFSIKSKDYNPCKTAKELASLFCIICNKPGHISFCCAHKDTYCTDCEEMGHRSSHATANCAPSFCNGGITEGYTNATIAINTKTANDDVELVNELLGECYLPKDMLPAYLKLCKVFVADYKKKESELEAKLVKNKVEDK